MDAARSQQGMNQKVAQIQIGFGPVRHRRSRPAVNEFSYQGYYLLLPLRSMAAGTVAPSPLPINRFAPISFHCADHGPWSDHGSKRPSNPADLLTWIDQLLAQQGICDADGEVWLHCYPRVLGYAFKPVSFWYCQRKSGSLRAIVVEVNNTFGQRHCYVLDQPQYGKALWADKVFHVSPFCEVKGHYQFWFMRTQSCAQARSVVRIDYFDQTAKADTGDGEPPNLATPLLKTSVSGKLETLTPSALRRAFWGYPFMTFGVIARIHWQALILLTKRVRFFSKPPLTAPFVT
jgi:uncharacterized protein